MTATVVVFDILFDVFLQQSKTFHDAGSVDFI